MLSCTLYALAFRLSLFLSLSFRLLYSCSCLVVVFMLLLSISLFVELNIFFSLETSLSPRATPTMLSIFLLVYNRAARPGILWDPTIMLHYYSQNPVLLSFSYLTFVVVLFIKLTAFSWLLLVFCVKLNYFRKAGSFQCIYFHFQWIAKNFPFFLNLKFPGEWYWNWVSS